MKRALRIALTAALLCPAAAQAAGGAFAVDDAAVEMPGVCKVETIAATGIKENADRFALSTPACAITLGTHRAEVAAGVGRRRASESYATPAVIKFKTPVPGLDFSPDGKSGLAFSAGYLADLDGDRRSGYFMTLPASYRINDAILLNANVGRTEYENRFESFTSWGVSTELNLKKIGYERLTLVAETFSPKRAETAYQFGARYTPSAAFDFDVLFGRNLGGERKNWLTLGLTQRF